MELYEQNFITMEQAVAWAGKMFEKFDYEKLDPETQEALANIEILDVP